MAVRPATPTGRGGDGGDEARRHSIAENGDDISWLRAELVAANAIIDLLVQRLSDIGEPGEYARLAESIQQRQSDWARLIIWPHLQLDLVGSALDQVSQRRPQRHQHISASVSPNEGEEKVNDETQASEGKDSSAAVERGLCNIPRSNKKCSLNDEETPVATEFHDSEAIPTDVCKDSISRGDANMVLYQDANQMATTTPEVFHAEDLIDGKMVNVVEGLKLYEGLLDRSQISELLYLAHHMRAAGQRGELPGKAFVRFKRADKGHGKDMIQLGIPILEGPPEDERTSQTSSERKVDSIPSLLQDVFDSLVQQLVLPVNPNFCKIDFFDVGDHLYAHRWPAWFGRPVCNLFLTECELVYGLAVSPDPQGNYIGSLSLHAAMGALLLMEGNSADQTKRAICVKQRDRIILTFGKAQPKNAAGVSKKKKK